MRVLIVSENISKRMGGEAREGLYYFELLQKRGINTWLICHARVKEELRQELSKDSFQKIYYVEDNWLSILVWRLSKLFSYRIEDLLFGQLIHFVTQIQARKKAKQMIKKFNINLIFEPTPITAKGISFMYNMGVPVVIGPLSGGLDFPPAFKYMDSPITRFCVNILCRSLSHIANYLIPGKLKADVLIVSNKKTIAALPPLCRGEMHEIIDCGVDLNFWKPHQFSEPRPNEPIRFVYMGNFVDWKGVQFLIDAFQKVTVHINSVLELIGDGRLRSSLEVQVKNLNIESHVNFHGWLSKEKSYQLLCKSDVFVMPSLRESGGNAVLEAMAVGLPIIATKWAGPAITVDSSCGILVEPRSKEGLINGLVDAMLHLSQSPELRFQMGIAGTKRVKTNYFDWDSKVDRIIEIFQEVLRLKI